MKRISFIAAAALLLVGAQLHAQAKTDSAKKKTAVTAAKPADKGAAVSTKKSADKPAGEVKTAGKSAAPSTTAAGTGSKSKKGTGTKRGSKTGAKKDSTAKKP